MKYRACYDNWHEVSIENHFGSKCSILLTLEEAIQKHQENQKRFQDCWIEDEDGFQIEE